MDGPPWLGRGESAEWNLDGTFGFGTFPSRPRLRSRDLAFGKREKREKDSSCAVQSGETASAVQKVHQFARRPMVFQAQNIADKQRA